MSSVWLLINTLVPSNFYIFVHVKLTLWQIYLKYLYVYISILLSLPWNSIHSEWLRIFPVHNVSALGGMFLHRTILSSIGASCPNLDAQHLWASNHVIPSLKKSLFFQINEWICNVSIFILSLAKKTLISNVVCTTRFWNNFHNSRFHAHN